MITGRPKAGGAVREGIEQRDRCPCQRPFATDFAGCPTYQPVSFVAVDGMSRPLAPGLTCGHLEVGAAERGGRFFPRCRLGSSAERTRWLAEQRPERVAVLATLQEEFDSATAGVRTAVRSARIALLRVPSDPAAADRLGRALHDYLAAARGFATAHSSRLRDVDLPPDALIETVRGWAQAWARSSRDDLAQFPAPGSGAVAGPLQVLPGLGGDADEAEIELTGRPVRNLLRVSTGGREERLPAAHDAERFAAAPAARELRVLLDSARLRIVQVAEPPSLQIAGDVDVSNATALATALAVVRQGAGDLHVDASALVSCDVAGLRTLALASTRRDAAGRVTVTGLAAPLRRVALLCGWGELLAPAADLADRVVPRSRNFAGRGGGWSPLVISRDSTAAGGEAFPEPPAGAELLPFETTSLQRVHDGAARSAARAGLRAAQVADAVCAVGELAANAVQHGGGHGVLSAWTEPDLLVFDVHDPGSFAAAGFDPGPDLADVAAGRGLWLAAQLCDLVQVHAAAGGTSVRLHLRRDG